jgi:hypothetical protein
MICKLKTNLVGMVRVSVHLIRKSVVQTVAWGRKLLVWDNNST